MPESTQINDTPREITIPLVIAIHIQPRNAHIPGNNGIILEPVIILGSVVVKNFNGIVKIEIKPDEVVTAFTLKPNEAFKRLDC
jgi:hypothetical protein